MACVLLLKSLLFVTLWIAHVEGQSQCTLADLDTVLGPRDAEAAGGLVSRSLALVRGGGQVSNPDIRILQYQVVCLAVGEVEGNFRGVSLVANYTCTFSGTQIEECTTASTEGQSILLLTSNHSNFVFPDMQGPLYPSLTLDVTVQMSGD